MGGSEPREGFETDLDRAELLESSSVQNAVVAGGFVALLAVPLSHLLAAVQRRLRRRKASLR